MFVVFLENKMPDFSIEETFISGDELRPGAALVAGGDEAGRGCLAGPVFAALVILDPEIIDPRINDSKKLSSPLRAELEDVIKKTALSWAVGSCDHREIDRYNILEATKLAFVRAFKELARKPDVILFDALSVPAIAVTQKKIIKGDLKSYTIAAASILAKQARDRYMTRIAAKYNNWFFAEHMGYGTKKHIKALEIYGPSPIHRLTFKPLKKTDDSQIRFF